MVFIL